MFPVGLWNTLRTEQLQELANFVCLHDCISTTCFKNKPDIIIINEVCTKFGIKACHGQR